jgi:hypothetical protein
MAVPVTDYGEWNENSVENKVFEGFGRIFLISFDILFRHFS